MIDDEVLTPSGFTRLFAPLVRVEVSWALVAVADANLTLSIVDSVSQTRSWYFPWYLDAGGRACGWDDPTATPVRVTEWRKASSGMSSHRRSSIFELAVELQRSDSPAGLLVPTYGLADKQRLVLDGSHRLAAIMEADLEFVAMEVCLHGPLDQQIVPDLIHWA